MRAGTGVGKDVRKLAAGVCRQEIPGRGRTGWDHVPGRGRAVVFSPDMHGSDVTRILAGDDSGPKAAEKLLALVYDELRKLAARRMADEPSGQTLQPTALVHEAYLRLVGTGGPEPQQWNGRGHFFAAAAEAMRRILVERARRAGRARHGGGRRRLDLDGPSAAQLDLPAAPGDGSLALDLLDLDEALTRLESHDPEAAAVVKLRYFAGMTIEEAAAAAGTSVRTANRHWAYAKAWLYRQLAAPGDRPPAAE